MIYALLGYDDNGQVNTIFHFDCINGYQENWSANVAKTAIQGGLSIADNISLENPKFTISSLISRYSVSNPDQQISWNGEDFDYILGGTSGARHIELRDTLREMFLSKTLFTLLETDQYTVNPNPYVAYEEMKTGIYREYKNCVISTFNIDLNSGANNTFFLSLNLEQLNIVDLAVRDLDASEMTPALQPLQKRDVNAGQASTSTSTSDDKTNPVADVSTKKADVAEAKEVHKRFDGANKQRPSWLPSNQPLEAELTELQRALGTNPTSGKVIVETKNGVTQTVVIGKQ